MLFSGFNDNSITELQRISTTATATTINPHGFFVDDIVGIYGVIESGWNGLHQVITIPDSTHFTFNIPNTVSSTTTGTIIVKYAPYIGYQYIEDPLDNTLTLFSGIAKYNNNDPVSLITLLEHDSGQFITSTVPDSNGAYSFYVKKGNKYIIVFVGNGIYRPEAYFYQAPN